MARLLVSGNHVDVFHLTANAGGCLSTFDLKKNNTLTRFTAEWLNLHLLFFSRTTYHFLVDENDY